MKINYLVLDLETEGTKTNKRFCNPLDSDHKVVTLQCLKKTHANSITDYTYMQGEDIREPGHLFDFINGLWDVDVIVGQNVKFDLLWLWGDPEIQEFINRGGKVWDTMTVEHLLRGQKVNAIKSEGHGELSLNHLSQKYGGTLKDEDVRKRYKGWTEEVVNEKGKVKKIKHKAMTTNQIIEELGFEQFISYAMHDVTNAELVFLSQARLVESLNMTPLIADYMEHYLACIEMEYNGLYIDKVKFEGLVEDHQRKLRVSYNVLYSTVMELDGWSKDIEFNPESKHHLSKVLFNCMNIPVSKAGKKLKTKEDNIFSTDEDTLLKLLGSNLSVESRSFIKELLNYRSLSKLVNTYLLGMQECINKTTGAIHPEYNTTVTRTGRLSSSNPNGQNLDPLFRKCVIPRQPGKIVTFDYNQLEVRIQAALAKCPQMLEDLRTNVDFHSKRLAYAEGMSYDEVINLVKTDDSWKEKRRSIGKPISFQKAYGAAPESISKSTGIPLEIVQRVFDEENKEYPEIQQYYDMITDYLKQTQQASPNLVQIRSKDKTHYFTVEGEQVHYSYIPMKNGKRYYIEQKACQTKRGIWRYWHSPTIQDYPIQGTAADIVSNRVGQAFRYIIQYPTDLRMIAEVHDELVLEIYDNIDLHIKNISDILERRDGVYSDLELKVDVGIADSWGDAK